MHEIDRHQLQVLLVEGAQLVDVMPAEEFAESHIAGAVHIPLADLAGQATERLRSDRPVVVYCYDSL